MTGCQEYELGFSDYCATHRHQRRFNKGVFADESDQTIGDIGELVDSVEKSGDTADN